MIRILAPAKINLYLRVVGRRPDGYHELETLFERIDLADELTLLPHPDRLALTCSDPTLSCGEDNLILQAARLLQKATSTTAGAAIELTKRIPIAAGLGGGSSDAAAALMALNDLWGLQLSRQTLVQLGAQLGADVPFFLYDAPYAIGLGRGDVCQPITRAARLAQVLVVPEARLSTKEIFEGSRFDPSTRFARSGSSRARPKAESRDDLTIGKPSISIVKHALRNGSLGELASGLWNDLEPEAIRRCPVIQTIQSALTSLGCPGTRLSGSGPAVFGLCRDLLHAQTVARQLADQAPRAWRIETIQTADVCTTV